MNHSCYGKYSVRSMDPSMGLSWKFQGGAKMSSRETFIVTSFMCLLGLVNSTLAHHRSGLVGIFGSQDLLFCGFSLTVSKPWGGSGTPSLNGWNLWLRNGGWSETNWDDFSIRSGSWEVHQRGLWQVEFAKIQAGTLKKDCYRIFQLSRPQYLKDWQIPSLYFVVFSFECWWWHVFDRLCPYTSTRAPWSEEIWRAYFSDGWLNHQLPWEPTFPSFFGI